MIATPAGSVPTGMGVPGVLVATAIGVTLSTDVDLPFLPAWRLEPTDVRLATAFVVAALLAVPRVRAWRRTRRSS